MFDLNWVVDNRTLLPGGASVPRRWLEKLGRSGAAVQELAQSADQLDVFRREPPLDAGDPLAALGRAASNAPPAEAAPERAEEPAATGARPARPTPPQARRRGASTPPARAEGPPLEQTLSATQLSGLAEGQRMAQIAAPTPRTSQRPAAAASHPGGREPATAKQPAWSRRNAPQAVAQQPRPASAQAQAPQAPGGTGVGPGPAAMPRSRAQAAIEAALAKIRPGLDGQAAPAATLLRSQLAHGAARTFAAHANGQTTAIAQALAGTLDVVVAPETLAPGQLARLAAQPLPGARQPGSVGGAPLGELAAEAHGRDVGPPAPVRAPAPPLATGTGALPPGVELLRAALARYEAARLAVPPLAEDRPAAPPGSPVQATEETAAAEPAPPTGPGVQNTFNVTVHLGRGADEPDDELAERLTHILVEQARRHGIDV